MKSRLGTTESPIGSNSDRNHWIDSLNRSFGLWKQPWCAMGTGYCSKGNTYPEINSALALSYAKERRYSMKDVLFGIYTPKPGDWLVWNYGGGKGHVDIVESFKAQNWTVIGANRSDAVREFSATTNELALRKAKWVINVQHKDVPKPTKQRTKYKIIKIEKLAATYYSNYFEGRRTANGEKFSNKKLTAAHNSLPFGTLVLVTNPKNNKSVIVKINDRIPNKFVVDLTTAAAKKIDFKSGKVYLNILKKM